MSNRKPRRKAGAGETTVNGSLDDPQSVDTLPLDRKDSGSHPPGPEAANLPAPSPTIFESPTVRAAGVSNYGRVASLVGHEVIERFGDGLFRRNCLSMIVGQPSAGKSTLGAWLCKQAKNPAILPGNEENLSVDLIPRLVANGVGLGKVFLLDGRQWTFPEDKDKLARVLSSWESDLLWIDPIDTYIGEQSENDGQAVRRALESLVRVAEEVKCTIIAARHPGKSRENPCPGSRQWKAVPREVWQLTVDLGPPLRRYVARIKPPPGVGNKPREYALVGDPEEPPRFSLGPEVSDGDVDLCYLTDRIDRWRIDQAENLLRSVLAEGPLPSAEVYKFGELERIGDRLMRRAAERIGVVVRRDGFGRSHHSTWELPPGNACPATLDVTQGHTPEGVSQCVDQSGRSGKKRTSRRKKVSNVPPSPSGGLQEAPGGVSSDTGA